MKVTVGTNMDIGPASEILERHGLSPGGKAQRYVAMNLLRVFDGYVPLRSGRLKDSASQNLAPPYTEIVYDTPYAKKMYYNPQYSFNGAPRRGAFWASRAWADNADAFLTDFEQAIKGGRL